MSIGCFVAECRVDIGPDVDTVRVSVNRSIVGEAAGQSEVLPLSPGITDLAVDFGSGNDRLVIQDYVLPGTLRVAMGDDDVRLIDSGALGTMDLDLGSGDEGGYAAGFEAPEVFEATTELCPDLE